MGRREGVEGKEGKEINACGEIVERNSCFKREEVQKKKSKANK